MTENKLMLGLPTGSGQFPHETVTALLQMRKTCPTMVQVIERQRTDKARNYIVKAALEAGSTHLLFIDDDNPPPSDTLEKLLAADKDIVCGVIPSRNADKNGVYNLCIFDKEEIEGINMYTHKNKVDLSGGTLIKVDGCGMGCTLIKREVLEKLYKKYEGEPFAYGDSTMCYDKEGMNNQRRTMSEDMEFSERAVNEGFEIWCETSIRPPHLGVPKVIKFSDNYIV